MEAATLLGPDTVCEPRHLDFLTGRKDAGRQTAARWRERACQTVASRRVRRLSRPFFDGAMPDSADRHGCSGTLNKCNVGALGLFCGGPPHSLTREPDCAIALTLFNSDIFSAPSPGMSARLLAPCVDTVESSAAAIGRMTPAYQGDLSVSSYRVCCMG